MSFFSSFNGLLSASGSATQARLRIAGFAWCLLAFTWCLAMSGAYVRLSDAGLGCPDWPGCYGYWYAPHQDQHLEQAAQLFPHAPVDSSKAWKEMAHRYGVSILSLGVLGLVLALEWGRRRLKQRWMSPGWSALIVVWLIGQALFGMWTVTLKLMPLIVTLHLLGGMIMLVWLTVIATRLSFPEWVRPLSNTNVWAIKITWALVLIQIALGGWVSTNYAAGACGSSFPLCRGEWMPHVMRWAPALQLQHPLGYTATGEPFPAAALVAIHWMHRVGALCVTLSVLGLAAHLFQARHRKWTVLLVGSVGLQLALGFLTIYGNLPLPVAVAHNGGAALLLIILTALWNSVAVSIRTSPGRFEQGAHIESTQGAR